MTATMPTIKRYRSKLGGRIFEVIQWEPGVDISEFCRGVPYAQTITAHLCSARVGWTWLSRYDHIAKDEHGRFEVLRCAMSDDFWSAVEPVN